MAPEVMAKKDYGLESDYFAVGVIAHECMLGRRPHFGKSKEEIRAVLTSSQAKDQY